MKLLQVLERELDVGMAVPLADDLGVDEQAVRGAVDVRQELPVLIERDRGLGGQMNPLSLQQVRRETAGSPRCP